MRNLAFIPALLALASIAQAAPAPLPETSVFPSAIGVNIHFTNARPGELEQIYAAGFRWVRMDLGWEGIERRKGEYNFSAYDRLIADLDQHHIKAILILDYNNRLYDGGRSPASDESRSAFCKWAAACAHHFKGHGILWEMWNEPNGTFWNPTANVDEYAKLALAVGQALRDAEPTEIYIGPATSTIDLAFLEACFKAGCLEYWSAVSVHPYRQNEPEIAIGEYRALRKLIAQYGPKDRQISIISGEWGYSSVWRDFDDTRQAKYLVRELLTNIANDVPVSIWYDWHEDGKDPKDAEHHFGIVLPDAVNKDGNLYEPKKAYLAARRMSEMLNGYYFSKRLWFADDRIQVLLFANDAGKPLLVGWTSSGEIAEVGVPIFGGAMPKDAVKDGEKILPADPHGIRMQFTDFPTYILPNGNEDLLRIAAAWTRAPLEMTAAGPGVEHLPTQVQNPLDHPITLLDGSRRIEIAPGKTAVLNPDITIGRQADSVPVTLDLNIENLGHIQQRSLILVSNPLTVQLLPRMGDVQYACVVNPGGEAFSATATLIGAPSADAPSANLEMKPGEKNGIIHFQIPRDFPADAVLGVKVVRKTDHALLLETPALRCVLLPGFTSGSKPRWKVIPDGDAKVASRQTLEEGNPTTGPIAPDASGIHLSYKFEAGWKFIRVSPADSAAAKVEGTPTALGLWIHGDAQGNMARMRFVDSTGQMFQPDGARVTWTGWRYIEFPISNHEMPHWSGANDGKVHFPIHLDSLFLLDSYSRRATSGDIFLSTPTLVYSQK